MAITEISFLYRSPDCTLISMVWFYLYLHTLCKHVFLSRLFVCPLRADTFWVLFVLLYFCESGDYDERKWEQGHTTQKQFLKIKTFMRFFCRFYFYNSKHEHASLKS